MTAFGRLASVRIMRQISKDELQEEPSKRKVITASADTILQNFCPLNWTGSGQMTLGVPADHQPDCGLVPNPVFSERKEDLFIVPLASNR
jgi:hypothetical protein